MNVPIRSPWLLAAAMALLVAQTQSSASDLMYGCCGRPACGKVCELVCEEATLVVACYGCECDTICVPGPSKPGCKHCVTACCGANGCCTACGDAGCNGGCQGSAPKCEFCWRDWIACGCAKPRTVKVLTKYEAERTICSYHWEVVDGCACGGCGGGVNCGCGCVYKPASGEAPVGQSMPLSGEEKVQLASWMAADAAQKNGQLAEAFNVPELQAQQQSAPSRAAAGTPEKNPSLIDRLSGVFGLTK